MWTCISTAQAHTKRVSAFCIQSGPQHFSGKFPHEMVMLMFFVTRGHALRLRKFAETVQFGIVIGPAPRYHIFLLLLLLFLPFRIIVLNIIFFFSRGIIILNILLSTSSSSTTSPYISSSSTFPSSTSSSSSSTSSFST